MPVRYDAGVSRTTDRSSAHRPTWLAAAVVASLAGVVLAQNAQNAAPEPDAQQPGPFLNEAQIQQIKRAEISPRDENLRFQFRNNLLRRYVDATPGLSFGQVRRAPDLQKALAILENGDDAMVADIYVRNDPIAVAEWRQRVQQVIVQGCATSACHGGPNAGEFYLHNVRNLNGEGPAYTNYFLINTANAAEAADDGSFFGGGAAALINRDRPELSPLLRYMLPPDQVEDGHPVMDGPNAYNGLVRGTNDPQYQLVGRWIEGLPSLTDPATAYGIQDVAVQEPLPDEAPEDALPPSE
jgi:hypothetical protein